MSFSDTSSFSQQRSQSQLWMGEIDPSWDEIALKSFWGSLGFPQAIIRLIRDPRQLAANAGYCFVEFPTMEQASQALAHNGVQIPNTNRTIRLNWANGNHQHGHGGSQVPHQQEFSIFIGDLAPDVVEPLLFEFFATKYSSVSGAKIMVDRVTNQSKGYGFVRFLDEAEQQRSLVEMQGSILNGRPIRVSTAAPRTRQPQQSQIMGQGQNQGQRQPFQQQQQQILTPQQPVQQPLNAFDPQAQPQFNQYTDPNNTTVFIGGLSSLVAEDELLLYFQPFGDITYVKIPVGKGCGFVQYVTRQSAELAILKMQGYPISNSRVRLSWGRSNANPANTQYKAQQQLPVIYGYPSKAPSIEGNGQLVNFNQYSVINSNHGVYGSDQILHQSQFNPEQSEGADQSRLNQLYMAAKDGRLDAIESASNGYIFN